jgi:8-oxo-dGTP diphosphatase
MRSIAGIARRGDRVFVARRLPVGEMGGKWEFPGGKVEPGESEGEAAVREFDEEFGLRVEPGGIIGESGFQNNGKRYELAAVLVGFLGEPPLLREHDQARWVGAAELVALDLSDSDRSLLPFVLPLLRT